MSSLHHCRSWENCKSSHGRYWICLHIYILRLKMIWKILTLPGWVVSIFLLCCNGLHIVAMGEALWEWLPLSSLLTSSGLATSAGLYHRSGLISGTKQTKSPSTSGHLCFPPPPQSSVCPHLLSPICRTTCLLLVLAFY